MKKNSIVILLLPIICTCFSCAMQSDDKLSMKRDVLFDKILGGWAAKTIGCTYGGPVEFMQNGTMIQDYTPIKWSDDRVEYYFRTFPGLYDDIYVNITFINVFERLGMDAPADAFANDFANAEYPLWHANQVARYNIHQGIMPPMSGHWTNNPHADDIDYQIESDYAGLMCPGMPNSASDISDRVGHIFCYGDGWYGGVFVGAMYSLAFTTDDIFRIVSGALSTIPSESDFYGCIQSVIDAWKEDPDDWKKAWYICQRDWSEERGCPDGIFLPFNIDAKINSAYVAIGLLYGQKDFFRTIDIAARCGQDSDCNAATAAGVLGTILGYDAIPEEWKKCLKNVKSLPFAYTDVSLIKLAELSFSHALKMIEKNGGTVDDENVVIRIQNPTAVRFEESFPDLMPIDKIPVQSRLLDSMSLFFEGSGFVQKGYVKCINPDYVAYVEQVIDDGKSLIVALPAGHDDSVDFRRVDLFHSYGLNDEPHIVKLKWLNPLDNAEIVLTENVIYSRKK